MHAVAVGVCNFFFISFSFSHWASLTFTELQKAGQSAEPCGGSWPRGARDTRAVGALLRAAEGARMCARFARINCSVEAWTVVSLGPCLRLCLCVWPWPAILFRPCSINPVNYGLDGIEKNL